MADVTTDARELATALAALEAGRADGVDASTSGPRPPRSRPACAAARPARPRPGPPAFGAAGGEFAHAAEVGAAYANAADAGAARAGSARPTAAPYARDLAEWRWPRRRSAS